MTVPTIPPIICNKPDDVVAVQALEGFRVRVQFFDGLEGEVDMGRLVNSSSAGVFAELADPVRFAQVYVQYGAVCWPGEIDLAPDAIYAAFVQSGEWVLG